MFTYLVKNTTSNAWFVVGRKEAAKLRKHQKNLKKFGMDSNLKLYIL